MPTVRHHHRAGYSFVELSIVVSILGIIGAVSAPAFSAAMMFRTAQGAAERITADLNLAREHALARGMSIAVTVTNSTDNYAIPAITHPDHPSQTYSVDLSSTGLCNVVLTANFSGYQTVTFTEWGLPVVGPGNTPLTTGTIAVNCHQRTYTVTIDATTGKASCQ